MTLCVVATSNSVLRDATTEAQQTPPPMEVNENTTNITVVTSKRNNKTKSHSCGTSDAGVQSVQSIVGETVEANRRDIAWLAQQLKDFRHDTIYEDDRILMEEMKRQIEQDRAAIKIAKELWLEASERKLYWLNLRRLSNEDPLWGHYESALELLDRYGELPFELFSPHLPTGGDGDDDEACSDKENDSHYNSPQQPPPYPLASVGKCFEQACLSRCFTVYKVVLYYALYVTMAHAYDTNHTSNNDNDNHHHHEEKKNDDGRRQTTTTTLRTQFIQNVLQNTQYIYPITVPKVLDDVLSACWLYNGNDYTLLIPNAGYVFGGLVQDTMPYNRGLDCTSFTGWITGCGRPLTYLYEWVYKQKTLGQAAAGVPPDAEDADMVSMLYPRHEVVPLCGSKIKPGDLLIWRHIEGGGHAMLVQKVINAQHVLTVECTNYKDGHYEGFQERVVPIMNPNEDGRQFVLRPLNQTTYQSFRNRSKRSILLKFS